MWPDRVSYQYALDGIYNYTCISMSKVNTLPKQEIWNDFNDMLELSKEDLPGFLGIHVQCFNMEVHVGMTHSKYSGCV